MFLDVISTYYGKGVMQIESCSEDCNDYFLIMSYHFHHSKVTFNRVDFHLLPHNSTTTKFVVKNRSRLYSIHNNRKYITEEGHRRVRKLLSFIFSCFIG